MVLVVACAITHFIGFQSNTYNDQVSFMLSPPYVSYLSLDCLIHFQNTCTSVHPKVEKMHFHHLFVNLFSSALDIT
jgi:hypothetical protein